MRYFTPLKQLFSRIPYLEYPFFDVFRVKILNNRCVVGFGCEVESVDKPHLISVDDPQVGGQPELVKQAGQFFPHLLFKPEVQQEIQRQPQEADPMIPDLPFLAQTLEVCGAVVAPHEQKTEEACKTAQAKRGSIPSRGSQPGSQQEHYQHQVDK